MSARRIEEVLAFTNLEHAGDVLDKNLLGHAAKRLKRNIALSHDQAKELAEIIARLIANLRASASVFMTEDLRAARLLATEKEAFRELESAATEQHFAHIRDGRTQGAVGSAWRLDLLRGLKRVNDHLVAAAAYPVFEGARRTVAHPVARERLRSSTRGRSAPSIYGLPPK